MGEGFEGFGEGGFEGLIFGGEDFGIRFGGLEGFEVEGLLIEAAVEFEDGFL